MISSHGTSWNLACHWLRVRIRLRDKGILFRQCSSSFPILGRAPRLRIKLYVDDVGSFDNPTSRSSWWCPKYVKEHSVPSTSTAQILDVFDDATGMHTKSQIFRSDATKLTCPKPLLFFRWNWLLSLRNIMSSRFTFWGSARSTFSC